MTQRAIFISRTAAMLAVIEHGREAGVSDDTIALRGATFPVYKRGEMKGFEAWYPTSEHSMDRNPVLEA